MYLLILESIGMPELILIGIVALIIFGPRKLPQMAKTVGKSMNEFKRATNDFKATWEKEASLQDLEADFEGRELRSNLIEEQTISRKTYPVKGENQPIPEDQPLLPEIKEVDPQEIEKRFSQNKITSPESNSETAEPGKRDWL